MPHTLPAEEPRNFTSRKALLIGHRRDCHNPARAMSDHDVLSNQKLILENQGAILSNQKNIQENQEIIKKNQESLNLILKNQEKILALLQK
jgi:hypothetical protein